MPASLCACIPRRALSCYLLLPPLPEACILILIIPPNPVLLSFIQLPIASYVPAPPEEPAWPSYLARDTRVSSAHPLRHAALNVVRALDNSTTSSSSSIIPATATASIPSPPTSASAKNGQHYLLTSRALFMTHEPCVMCSMALLHSRVKEVFYLVPMQRTGGCGGAACVPKLEGVNHRFAIGRWKTGAGGVSVEELEIDEDIDS